MTQPPGQGGRVTGDLGPCNEVVFDVLIGAAGELHRMAAERFDEHGPHDVRGAAIWDSAAWLCEVYAPRMTGMDGLHRDV